MSVRRSFKPMPGDHHIDDEDERCRVRNQDFVAKVKRSRERRGKFAWGLLCAAGILLALGVVWGMSLPH